MFYTPPKFSHKLNNVIRMQKKRTAFYKNYNFVKNQVETVWKRKSKENTKHSCEF